MSTTQKIIYLVIGIIAIGIISQFFKGEITFKQDGLALFQEQLIYLGLLTIVIERATEAYLKITDNNGTPRIQANADRKIKDGTRVATMTSMTIGIIIALAGVRLLGSFMEPTQLAAQHNDEFWNIPSIAFFGIDVFITAALLAGGSAIFHEIPEAIISLLNPIHNKKD